MERVRPAPLVTCGRYLLIIYVGDGYLIGRTFLFLFLGIRSNLAQKIHSHVLVCQVAEYGVYKTAVLFFGLLDLVVGEMWTGIPTKPEQVSQVLVAERLDKGSHKNND